MKLSIEGTADEIQKVLQAIGGDEEHLNKDELVKKIDAGLLQHSAQGLK